jgi:CRISPR-associated protein Cas8a1/Csx13
MGTDVRSASTPDETGGQMTIDLFGPGMTALHKAGLAGLWMTLKALEEEHGEAKLDGGCWERAPTSVTLHWEGKANVFFDALFKASFKIDKNGLIWFPALGEPMDHPQHAVVLQESVLGSFLQHGRTRKSDSSAEPHGSVSVDVDGRNVPLQFHRVSEYAHQTGAFCATAINALTGWHFPGAAVRHVGLGQEATALQELPERALALRYSPIGVVYFEIRRRGGGVRPRYAIVTSEITDLAKYTEARECFVSYGVQQLYAAGTAEAGLRVLAELKSANLLEDIRSAFCHVISFGTLPWSTQQKTRVNLMTVRVGSERALRTFQLCRQVLTTRFVAPEGRDPFWDTPQVPDLVARNLSEGRPWWNGFAEFVADRERGRHVFRYEKGGLGKMIEDRDAFPEGPEHAFVRACHEAWRRRMGKLSEKAEREGSSFRDAVSREFEKVRVGFSRCKNEATLRAAVTDFWARAGGPLEPLQSGWREVLGLLDDKNWRKAKDLALLALASYEPQTREESDALSTTDREESEGGQQ